MRASGLLDGVMPRDNCERMAPERAHPDDSSSGERFDDAPTSELDAPVRSADRAAQLRRFALVGMRIAEAAHKLNNATGTILGYAHLLDEGPDAAPVSADVARAIVRQAERCAELSRSLTELAMVSSQRPVRVAPSQIFADVLAQARSAGCLAGRHVDVEASGPLPNVFARRHDVVIAVGHLLHNALDASAVGSTVVLSAARASRRGREGVALAVRDTGEGIAGADLARVFEPFFTTRSASGHAGLGLPIARAIVDQDGGQIEIESGNASGTTVRVWLPLPEEPARQRPRATSGTRVKGGM